MKKALWFAALALVGCSQAPVAGNLAENVAASATTTSKTGVEVWALKGSSSGVEVKGQTAMGKTLHSISVNLKADKTCEVVKTYRDSSGATLASLSLKLDKDGKRLSSTPSGNPSDTALCPECMSNDLKASDPTALAQMGVDAQVTTPKLSPCQRAQRRLANAAAAIVANCYGSTVDPLACAASEAAYGLAYQDFVEFCGNPFGVSAARRFWANHQPHPRIARRSLSGG